MYLCQKNQIRNLSKGEYEILKLLTRLSKNVYNEMMYSLRNYYQINNTFLSYPDLCKMVKSSENYEKNTFASRTTSAEGSHEELEIVFSCFE